MNDSEITRAGKGLAIAASHDFDDMRGRHVHGIYLLFAAGERPDHAAIRAFAKQHSSLAISFDPQNSSSLRVVGDDGTLPPLPERQWVELICAGLTFDLEGLAPAKPDALPEAEYFFDFPGRASVASCEGMWLTPGRHLSGGENSLPVLRGLMSLARDMVRHFEQLEAALWPPARSVVGRRFFESTMTAWLEGGAFPALGMTAFRENFEGGLSSVGLEYLVGQELWIEPALSGDKVAATRLGIRLVNQLVMMGGITGTDHIIAPDGTRLTLSLSKNQKYIRVRSE